jgi:hypothetical protein
MSEFRTHGPDVMQAQRSKKVVPGKIAPSRLGVYDGKGRLRGQVGPLATASTCARFHGQLGSKIGKGPDGKPAWLAPKATADKPNKQAAAQAARLAASLRADKGSVSK